MSLLACLALFLASANLVRSRARRKAFTAVLVLAAVARLVLAFAGGRASPPAAASDAAAAHAEIALALCFGAVWAEALTGGRRVREEADRAERFEGRALPLTARLLVWGGVALGLVLAGPAAAVRAAAATTLALALAGIRHRRARHRRGSSTAVALATAAALAVAGAMAGAPLLFERGSEIRGALGAWRLFPALGSGLGTLREALSRVAPAGPAGSIEKPPGDALTILVTGGAVGAALAAALLASLFTLLFSAWQAQRHRAERAFVLASLGAMLSLALHGLAGPALVDPTVAASLAAVAGAAWAAGRAR